MIITLLLFTRITTWIKQIEVLLVIWKSKILPDWLLPVLIADLLLNWMQTSPTNYRSYDNTTRATHYETVKL